MYLNHMFWVGMLSTQRSESVHAFFDGYLRSTSTLKYFVEQYEITIIHKVEKEVYADYKSSTFWEEGCILKCNCRLFECSEMLCTHILKVASIKRKKDVHRRHSRIFFDEGYPHMIDEFEKIKDVKKAFNETVDLAIAIPARLGYWKH
ncbi:hypothetical protein M9H77_03550 [Catharanthus roseus]|uniref:Uncharacterized protein n=1 Tax=Catharanthus roseus TaxID=4058 RepID=A0ACC0CBR6_CATRO|nr:hypothetical protein M9H77_03550 [Catharanthus roseus]